MPKTRLPAIGYTVGNCPYCGSEIEVVDPATLRARREAAGVSARAFAAKCGLSPPYVSDIERGRRNATDRIVKMYEALGR